MRQHTTLPDLPSGYPLSPCRGMWSVIVPAAATNLIINPSVELSDDGYSASSASSSRTADAQRHGVYGLQVDPGATDGSLAYAMALAPDTTYTFSVDHLGPAGIPYRLRVYDVTAGAYLSSSTEFRGTGFWERRRLTFVTSANASFQLVVAQNGGSTTPVFSTDGWQLVQAPQDTTYIDGDQAGCAWVGTRHASISRRSAQTRQGGRIVPLDDYGFTVLSELGLGMVPAEDITTPTGLLGGALYQRTIQRVRSFSLLGQFSATTYAQLQRLQAELHAALTPFGLARQQPLVLRYRALEGGMPIGEELEILCHYTGGLEGATDNLYGERCALQFTMYQPLLLSAGEAGVALGTNESIPDADRIVERQTTGVWHALGGGVDGPLVNAVVYGPDGNLYVGGDFSTAYNAAGTGSPLVVNNVARWDGESWSTLGSGLNNDVQVLAFDAAGNLYAGGIFTDAAHPYLAVWDGSAWAPVGLAADATSPVYAIVVDHAGNLIIGGAFDDWAGIAGADRIAWWNGSAWAAFGTGANGTVYALAIDPANGELIVGGAFTTIGGASADRVAVWNLISWEAIGDGFNDDVYALAFGADGTLYAGGAFTDAEHAYAARRGKWITYSWGSVNGNDLVLGDNSAVLNNVVHAIGRNIITGQVLFGGAFTAAGSLTLANRLALWNGGAWRALDVDLPGSPIVYAIGGHSDGRLAIGYDTSGTATASTADTDVVNSGSAPAAPIFTITGPGLLESIVNWTSGKALRFSLTLQDGETVTIDLTPGAIAVTSTFRGDLGGSVLSGSDLASWRLLPGVNTIIVKSATVPVLMRWRPAYTSLQGATR